jgi:hypothetical protein
MEHTEKTRRKRRAQKIGTPKRALFQRLHLGQLDRTQLSLKRVGLPRLGEAHLLSGSAVSENLECLTEKVGTLDLQICEKNRSGVTKKRERKAKRPGAAAGHSGSGQNQIAPVSNRLTLRDPVHLGLHRDRERLPWS